MKRNGQGRRTSGCSLLAQSLEFPVVVLLLTCSTACLEVSPIFSWASRDMQPAPPRAVRLSRAPLGVRFTKPIVLTIVYQSNLCKLQPTSSLLCSLILCSRLQHFF